MDIEPERAYRRALGAFPTGVTVVTAKDDEGPLGLTVNSFTSVSLSPRLVLWCLDDRSDRRRLFDDADRYVINVLKAEDQAHSDRFAFGAFRIDPADLEFGTSGAPRLRDSLAWFECVAQRRIQVGDHTVIIGEVIDFAARRGDALLWFRGRYGVAEEGDLA